ncbi:hypothetical protein MOOTH_06370 [Moorella thermoacetica]|nr:hypothetical protein MOOTH_06370 [Moorella thermoacetica]OIQ62705.1 hypothetical protein MTIN_01620 [Moorella thermoacetica]
MVSWELGAVGLISTAFPVANGLSGIIIISQKFSYK